MRQLKDCNNIDELYSYMLEVSKKMQEKNNAEIEELIKKFNQGQTETNSVPNKD